MIAPATDTPIGAASATPPLDVEPVNILLVDDHLSNLRSLEAMLNRPDYNLVRARSGREALGQILRHEFVVILLDVAMPEMDGFETAAIIKEREQSRLIPIIFITASVFGMEHIFHGYKVGAVDYLRKPLDPHAVRAKVSVFVDLFRERRRGERQARQLQAAERLLRARAEAALEESEAVYETTFAEAPIGIGHASSDGVCTVANRKLVEILTNGAGPPVGRRIEEMLDPAGARPLVEAMERLRSGAESVHSGEYRLATKGTVWARVTLSVTCAADGRLQRFIIVVDDVSKRKEVEVERARLVQELRHAVQARDDFLAIAAHELKTPMTPLRLQTAGVLHGLRRATSDGTADEALARRLEAIDAASARLDALIDRLLDASRISVGRMTITLEDVELQQLLGDVAAQLGEEAERSGSTIDVVSNDPIHGRWDRVRLGQLVTNLLSNAIKYGAGRPITLSATTDGETARIHVRDRGVGIPVESQQRIFERFERLAPVRHHGGFGLGLWIVREIAAAHGGSVTVSSRPGEGAVFTVVLPLGSIDEPRPGGVRDEGALRGVSP